MTGGFWLQRQGPALIDPASQGRGVCLGKQRAEVGGADPGIAHPAEPLPEGQLVRLHLEVNPIHRVARHPGALEDIERDQEDQALRYGRLLQYRPAPVGGPDRLEDLGAMFGEITLGEQAAGAVRGGDDRVGDPAAVEGARPLRLQGP